jgi:hypothetical protein
MLGPICQYQPLPRTAMTAPREPAQLMQYAALEKDEDEPNPENSWYLASKQLSFFVSNGRAEVMVHIHGLQSLKYVFVKGNVDQDGYARYKHCRGNHPDLFFCYVSTKVVALEAVSITSDAQWAVDVVGQVTGEKITSIVLSPMKTVGHAINQIVEHMQEQKHLTRKNTLEIVTFAGCKNQIKLKKSPLQLPVEAQCKRMKR